LWQVRLWGFNRVLNWVLTIVWIATSLAFLVVVAAIVNTARMNRTAPDLWSKESLLVAGFASVAFFSGVLADGGLDLGLWGALLVGTVMGLAGLLLEYTLIWQVLFVVRRRSPRRNRSSRD
jgi:hypothetical protein